MKSLLIHQKMIEAHYFFMLYYIEKYRLYGEVALVFLLVMPLLFPIITDESVREGVSTFSTYAELGIFGKKAVYAIVKS